jgi:DNA polymerase-4
VIAACESVLPVEKVCSIDEMRFRLLGEERQPAMAIELARTLKHVIHENVGQYMNCSIGIAPNPFLAKIATEIQKPDGLVVLQADDLPKRLHCLKLTDFTGINRRTAARLNAAGIFSSEQLCLASRQELRSAFASVIGERWWYLLRGYDLEQEENERQSLSHSHVLPPNLRTDQGCREVLLRLLQKASARLRSEKLWTTGMIVSVSAFEKSWSMRVKLPPTQDTITLNEYFQEAWQLRDFVKPRGVGVCFTDLHPAEEVTPSLFDPTADRALLNKAVDRVNQKYGKNTIYLAGMQKVKNSAPERIAFNKTWLFKEGKGDNEWIDTFRGTEKDD